ncbi:MAG: glycosyltransferase family 4 protein [Candidatus Woesearchaeota archaeon]
MKKLLIITDSFPPRWDGISRFLTELIPSLTKHFQVTVIAPEFKGNIEASGYNLILVPTYKFSLGDYTPAHVPKRLIKKEIKKHSIIWSQTLGPLGCFGIRYAYKMKKQVAAFTHSIEWELFSRSITRSFLLRSGISKFTEALVRYHYNRCNLLMIPSEGIREKLREHHISTKTKVIHLGTDVHRFKPPKDKGAAKKAIGLKEDSTVIGYVGRIGREKDLPTLHTAFSELREKHDNLHLVIVGEGNKSEEEKIQGSGVMRLGSIDNVVPYLQAMDIYVLPSLTETSSLSTMEAMSTGLAVVTTPVGHLRYYIKNRDNGLLFHPQDSYELKDLLEELILDPNFRLELGKKARETMIRDYSWQQTEEKIIEELNSIP